MSGTAAAVGDAATPSSNLAHTADIITALAAAFGQTPVVSQVQPVAPAPVSNPDRASTLSIAGIGIGTLALIGIGVIVAVKLLK